MPVSLSEAIEYLLGSQTQSTARLRLLGQYCIEAFAREGLPGVGGGRAAEVGIRGLARQKNWDLAFVLAGKPRLLVSLKSILANIGGSVPNRIDDLMGEVANARITNSVETEQKGAHFFRALLSELYLREPTLRPAADAG